MFGPVILRTGTNCSFSHHRFYHGGHEGGTKDTEIQEASLHVLREIFVFSVVKNNRFVPVLRISNNFNTASAAFFFFHDNLLVDALFQFGDVRDNAHQQIAFG